MTTTRFFALLATFNALAMVVTYPEQWTGVVVGISFGWMAFEALHELRTLP